MFYQREVTLLDIEKRVENDLILFKVENDIVKRYNVGQPNSIFRHINRQCGKSKSLRTFQLNCTGMT